jgi:hypothetical protein
LASKQTNSMAIVSVVSGALGWVGVPLIASIVAVVCGHIARGQIRQTGEEGDVLAIIGLVLGYAHILAICLGTIAVVLIYGGLIAFLAAMGVASQ